MSYLNTKGEKIMKTNTLSTGGTNVSVILLGVLAAALVFAVLTGRKVPLLNNERVVLIALVVIGMGMCTAGIGRVAASGAWLHPLSVIGYLLGATILVIGVAAVFGKQVPPLTSYYQSFAVVAGLAGVKLALSTLHQLFM
jgi:hypothetical protein